MDGVKFVDLSDSGYVLIGTNGALKTKANGIKDGDDWYFYSNKDGRIFAYANDKDFSKSDDYDMLKERADEMTWDVEGDFGFDDDYRHDYNDDFNGGFDYDYGYDRDYGYGTEW